MEIKNKMTATEFELVRNLRDSIYLIIYNYLKYRYDHNGFLSSPPDMNVMDGYLDDLNNTFERLENLIADIAVKKYKEEKEENDNT